jgi:hypothetical protein
VRNPHLDHFALTAVSEGKSTTGLRGGRMLERAGFGSNAARSQYLCILSYSPQLLA